MTVNKSVTKLTMMQNVYDAKEHLLESAAVEHPLVNVGQTGNDAKRLESSGIDLHSNIQCVYL